MREPAVGTRRILAAAIVAALLVAACGAAGQTTAPTGTQAAPTVAPTNAATGTPTGPAELPPPEQKSVAFVVSAPDFSVFAMQAAHDLGLFKKWGLESKAVFIEGTQPATQTLLSGGVQFATNASAQSIQSLTTSQPLVDVGLLADRLPDWCFGGRGITTGDDVRGQRVGISQLGGQSHAGIVLCAKALGLEASDIQIVAIGGQGARIAALQAGTVAAVVASSDRAPALTAEGFTVLAKMNTPEAAPFASGNIQARRDWVAANPNTTLRFVLACLEAVQFFYTDTQRTAELFAAFTQLDLADSLAEVNAILESGIFVRNLRPYLEAYKAPREILLTVNPGVSGVDLNQAFDTTFVDKLEEMGYFKLLGVPAS